MQAEGLSSDPRAMGAAAGAGLFIAIWLDVVAGGFLASRLDPFMNVAAPAAVERVASVVTFLGGWQVLSIVALVGAVVLARRERGADALILLFGSAAGSAAVHVLKWVAAQPRPGEFSSSLTSFPSGHAANSLIVWALTLALVASPGHRRGAWLATGAISLAVGVSRLVLGVHWATDVLAGWAFGGFWLAGIFFYRARRRVTSAL